MTVYVVDCEGHHLVKIGYTADDPASRVASLQTGSPYPLRLLWVSGPDCGRETEEKLHTLFAAYRAHGEWFDFGDADPAALVAAAVLLPALKAPLQPPLWRPPKPCAAPIEPAAPPDSKVHVAPRSLLEDLDAVLGEFPIPVAKAAALLASRYPERGAYRNLTGKTLRADLAAFGVRVPSTGNRWPVSRHAIRGALASRAIDAA